MNNLLNILQETIIPTIQLEESYKVDIIRVYFDDLQHIKLNSLCEYMRWEIMERAIIGTDLNTLNFYSFNNCTLSDIAFSVQGDIVEREFELRNHWPTRGYPLAFKMDEGLTTRRILGLSLVQDYTFLVNDKDLPQLPQLPPRSPISGESALNLNILPSRNLNIIPELEEELVITSPTNSNLELEESNEIPSIYLNQNLDLESLHTPILPNNIYSLESRNNSETTLVINSSPTPDTIISLNNSDPNGPTALASRLEYQLNWNQTQINIQNSSDTNIVQISEID